MTAKPQISIVIEGYNETKGQGTANDSMVALARQDYPLDQVEVVLVGSAEQAAGWRARFTDPAPFGAVTAIAAEGANYFQLKNRGADLSEGEIVVFTDSDVRQSTDWLQAIVASMELGADVAVGLSLFKDADGWTARSLFRWMAVSITFGFILGPIRNRSDRGLPWPDVTVRGFMDHNVAVRADLARAQPYPTQYGRLIAPALLFRALLSGGANVVLNPRQKVVHYFAWRYWIHKLHFRYGYEVYNLRRLDPHYPARWIARTGPLEPLATWGWHVLLDAPRWLRFSRLMGMGVVGRWASLPLALGLSTVARGAECAGMFATMIAPERMRRWAEQV